MLNLDFSVARLSSVVSTVKGKKFARQLANLTCSGEVLERPSGSTNALSKLSREATPPPSVLKKACSWFDFRSPS